VLFVAGKLLLIELVLSESIYSAARSGLFCIGQPLSLDEILIEIRRSRERKELSLSKIQPKQGTQLEPLYLARRTLGKLRNKLYPSRIFEFCQPVKRPLF